MRIAVIAVSSVVALCALAFGALSIMAGGMSDNISAGQEAGRSGVWFLGIGAAAGVAAIAAGIFM